MTWRDMLSEKDIANGKYWTEPWGLVNKCGKVSEGCLHCWAETMWKRKHPGEKWSGVICRGDKLSLPSRRGKGKVFSVWNDFFHEDALDEFRQMALDIMNKVDRHIYLILTKRADYMSGFLDAWVNEFEFPLGGHIWFGTTAENQARLDERLPHLLRVPVNRFLSAEPLLGPIDISAATNRESTIHWVIVGCETGPGRRPCPKEWIESVVDQCREAHVPCWVKAVNINGKASHKMSEWPEQLRVRQLPGEVR
jgi:protein gp37